MSSLRLVLERESLELSDDGLVTGVLFFEFNARAFPERDWNDFVLVVLGWWARELSEFRDLNCAEVDLSFMDGPFVVRLCRREEVCTAEMTERYQNRVLARVPFDLEELILQVVKAASTVLKFLGDDPYASSDVAILRDALGRLTS